MKLLQIIVYMGISLALTNTTNAAAAGESEHYTIPNTARIVLDSDDYYTYAHWDYAGHPFDALRTNQYGYIHPTKGTFHKRLYKTPAIHRYHGAGSITQPLYFILPPAAYSNLPPSIKAIIPSADNIDICFLVTVVQDWVEADEDPTGRPLALRPHYWNDPDAPYSDTEKAEGEEYSKSFSDEVGIFDPMPPKLRASNTVNTLYPETEVTHGRELIVSSGNSDHLVGGYTYTPGNTDDLNLCFWGVVRGPTPSGPRTAITLHWVTSIHSLPAIRRLTAQANISHGARYAESFSIYPPCAERLRSLLGLPIERARGDISTVGKVVVCTGGGAGGTGLSYDAELEATLRASMTDNSSRGSGAGVSGGRAYRDDDEALATALRTSMTDSSSRGSGAGGSRGRAYGDYDEALATALSASMADSSSRGGSVAGRSSGGAYREERDKLNTIQRDLQSINFNFKKARSLIGDNIATLNDGQLLALANTPEDLKNILALMGEDVLATIEAFDISPENVIKSIIISERGAFPYSPKKEENLQILLGYLNIS